MIRMIEQLSQNMPRLKACVAAQKGLALRLLNDGFNAVCVALDVHLPTPMLFIRI